MAANWTFGRILAIGYAVAGLALLIVAVAGYRSASNLIDDSQLVSHTHQVRRELAEVLSHLVDVETGARGYVITGAEDYLEPYQSGSAAVKTNLDELRRLTVDNAEQQRRLKDLAPLVDARLKAAANAIALRRSGGLDAGVRAIASNSGKDLMDQIRTVIGEADRQEAGLLDQRASAAQGSAQLTTGIILWGTFLGVILILLVGGFTIMSLTRRVGGAVGLVQSSSAELQAAANQQATGAKEQASAMSEIATTIRELIATSHQIAESAQRVAQIAEDTNASASEGDAAVDKANASISGIRAQMDVIVNHMLDLGRRSQQIGSVLDIVSELAEQTNILAINATIEATGAGDAGKRFGVVADEIRKLSDRVAGSTKEIRGMIDDVRAAVNTTVMATEGGSKAVDAGAREFAEVTSAFKQIAGLVETTTEAAKEIELSTKQQSTAVEQVNVATANVAQATQETEASSGQILQTASELAGLSRDLARIIRREARA